MRNYLILDGVDSRDFGVYISGQGTFSAPSKAYSYQDVPGRNGAYIRSDKRFDNIEVTYPAFIYANFKTNISNFRNFLLSREGYVRLEDTYNTDEFRLASYTGAFEPDVTSINDAGRFDIVFNCMPQRFLKSGETERTGSPALLNNPTSFPAKPILKLTFSEEIELNIINLSGSQTIDDYRITSSGLQTEGLTSATIDCETMQAYSGSRNINKYISVTSVSGRYTVDFPVFRPFADTLLRTYSNTSWSVVPRWWKL